MIQRPAVPPARLVDPWPIDQALGPSFSVPSGRVIFRCGDRLTHLHYIDAGIVMRLVVLPDGGERGVGLRTAGWMLGVNSAVLDARQYATAVALTPCAIRTIALERFSTLSEDDVAVSRWVQRMLARDIRRHARLVELFGSDSQARLRWHLAWFGRAGGSPLPDGGWHIAFVPTHEQLGVLIGTTREHVTRLVAELEQRGEIRHRSGRYDIPVRSPLFTLLFHSRDRSQAGEGNDLVTYRDDADWWM